MKLGVASRLLEPTFPLERRVALSETAVALFGWRYLELVHRALAASVPAPARELSWCVEPDPEAGPTLVVRWKPREDVASRLQMLEPRAWDSVAFQGAAFPALYRTNPGA